MSQRTISMRAQTTAILSLIVLTFVARLAFTAWHDPLTVEIDQYSERPELGKLFWAAGTEGFSLEKHRSWSISAGRMNTRTIHISERHRPNSLRLDPIARTGDIWIHEIRLSTRRESIELQGENLAALIKQKNHIGKTSQDGHILYMESIGNDPWFSFQVPQKLHHTHNSQWLLDAFIFSMVIGFIATVAIQGWRRVRPVSTGERLTALLEQRTSLVIALLSGCMLSALFITNIKISSVTPVLQGPDEISHIANSFHGFARVFGEDYSCGDVWEPINEIRELVRDINNNPNRIFDRSTIVELSAIFERYQWSNTEQRNFSKTYYESCASDNWFSRYFYNSLTIPMFVINPDQHAGHYLGLLRNGQTLITFILYALAILLIAKGKFALKSIDFISVERLRLVTLLAFLLYISLPQNVFLTSVTSREAYLVPLGIIVFLSFLFRIRGLTELLVFTFALVVWQRRPPFLLPVFLLGLWYISLYFRYRSGWKLLNFAPTIATMIVFLIVPLILLVAVQLEPLINLRLPQEILALDNTWLYYKEAWRLSWHGLTLNVLTDITFVGHLGSLDTMLPPSVFTNIKMIFLLLTTIAIVTLFAKAKGLYQASSRATFSFNSDLLAASSLFLAAIPLALGVIGYTVYEIYSISGSHRPWGWGVQGRYFLPIYFPVFLTWFVASFVLLIIKSTNQSFNNGFGFTFVIVYISILASTLLNMNASVSALIWRYFGDERLLQSYFDIF